MCHTDGTMQWFYFWWAICETINYAMFLTLNFSYLDLCVWRGRHLWFTLKPESCPGSPFLHSWSAPMAPEALHPVSSFLEKIWVSKYQLCCFLFQVKFGNHKFTPIFICFSPILGFLILSEANPLPVWPSLYFVSSYSSCSNTSSLSIFSLYLSTDLPPPLTKCSRLSQAAAQSHRLRSTTTWLLAHFS